MKKRVYKKIKKYFLKMLVSVLVVVLTFLIPVVSFETEDNLTLIFKGFVGAKSKFEGMIEIWNIDTFEGCNISKTNALKKVAEDFQKENQGAYVIVRNVTEMECFNLLSSGQRPDMFSCSYGVAETIKPYIQSFENDKFEVYNSFLSAGKNETGDLMGVAWCSNFYFLISTKSHLEMAKIEDVGNVELSKVVFDLGYEKTLKQGAKTIYSCSVGSKKYLLPFEAIKTYNKDKKLKSFSEKSFDLAVYEETSYSAYVNFLTGNAVVLLGNFHDVLRMEKRVGLGKSADLVLEWISASTDMVQFLFLAQTENKEKIESMHKFVQMSTSKKWQEYFCKQGLFPVVQIDPKESVMKHIVLDKIKDCTLFNVFLTKSEIERLQQNLSFK